MSSPHLTFLLLLFWFNIPFRLDPVTPVSSFPAEPHLAPATATLFAYLRSLLQGLREERKDSINKWPSVKSSFVLYPNVLTLIVSAKNFKLDQLEFWIDSGHI